MSTKSFEDVHREAAYEHSFDNWIASVERFILEEGPDHFEATDHPYEILSDTEWNTWCDAYRKWNVA